MCCTNIDSFFIILLSPIHSGDVRVFFFLPRNVIKWGYSIYLFLSLVDGRSYQLRNTNVAPHTDYEIIRKFNTRITRKVLDVGALVYGNVCLNCYITQKHFNVLCKPFPMVRFKNR
jgi:hypothetical protein